MEQELKTRLTAHLEWIDDLLKGMTVLYADIKKRNRELLEELLKEEKGAGEDVT